MSIPQTINLPFLSFSTHYLLLALLVLTASFFLWKESTKDGFDTEHIYDLFFGLTAAMGLAAFTLNYYAPYKLFIRDFKEELFIYGMTIVSLLTIRIATKIWKWSLYRTLDIFSFFYFFVFAYFFGMHLVSNFQPVNLTALIVFSVLYLAAFSFRSKILSGALFSFILLLVAIVGQFFYTNNAYLIFYFILITISSVNLFYRSKKTMTTNNKNINLIEKLKAMLVKKDKRLKVEQQKLIEEDPYLVEGRADGNSEDIDEAILEDLTKDEIEIKKENVKEMQDQVKKALDKIDEGNYGICDKCGEPIDKARLSVYPEATTCMKCAHRE